MNKRKKFGIATAVAGLAMVFGGLAVGPGSASATVVTTQTVSLHNNTADTQTDCPDSLNDYWHFVIAPNSGYSFVEITLAWTGGGSATFSGSQIIKNGSQTDNVFIAVPAGQTLTTLATVGSSAKIAPATGDVRFVLSHLCDGDTTTTTTAAATTTTAAATTTTAAATTTTEAATTTTEAATTTTEAATTTTAAATTTTEAATTTTEAATTTTEAATTTTEVGSEGPTTTVAEETTTTMETTTTEVGSEGPTTTASASEGPTTTLVSPAPGLPRTGSNQSMLIVLGLAMILGGFLSIALTRRPDEA